MSAPDAPDSTPDGPAGLVPYPPDVVARYRSQGLWLGLPLGAELHRAALRFAERTALVTADGRWTYAELDEQSLAFATGLLSATTLQPGDPVMFSMGNVAETVVAYYGCLHAGLVPVCTLPAHRHREIGLLARHTGARGYVVQADYRDAALSTMAAEITAAIDSLTELVVVRGAVPAGASSYDDIIAAGRQPAARSALPAVDPTAIAAFQLSGGTTGLPKVAPRLHEEYAYNARRWAQSLGYGPQTVVLYPLPVMHNAGISLALQPTHLTGGFVVLTESADTGLILDAVAAHRPTIMPLVPPAVAIRLLDDPRSRATALSSLHDVVVGGQRLPVEVGERLERELGIRARQMFGMAEGMFLITPPAAGDAVRLHTVGAPISPADEVRIYDVATETEVPDGQAGEFCARGPYTIRGYYRAAAHNEVAFTADGFYRTGDLARRHLVGDQAFYSIDGRIKDVINRGVEKIHAEEVEELVVRHPAVQTAALVAMPDPVLGERVCAYLVQEPSTDPLTVQTLAVHLLAEGLAKYKLPERVEVVGELPLTNVGKVSKKLLREDIAARLAAEGVPGR